VGSVPCWHWQRISVVVFLVKLMADLKRPKYIPEGKLASVSVQNV